MQNELFALWVRWNVAQSAINTENNAVGKNETFAIKTIKTTGIALLKCEVSKMLCH